MPASDTDTFLVNRGGQSFKAQFTDLMQGIDTKISIGDSVQPSQINLTNEFVSSTPHISLRKDSNADSDFRYISFLLGNDDITDTDLYAYPAISVRTDSAPTAISDSVSLNAYFQVTAPGGFVVGTGSSERFRITDGGNIGVQTTNPYCDFHVQSSDIVKTYAKEEKVVHMIERADGCTFSIATDASAESKLAFSDQDALAAGSVEYDHQQEEMYLKVGSDTTQMTLKSTGVINIPNCPVAADNDAAIGQGLDVGDVYRTATGELRIVYSA